MPRREPETIVVKKAVFAWEGQWATCDVFEHNGRNWLVGRWIGLADRRFSRPERMVLMDALECSDIGPADEENPVDWLILTNFPTSIFDPRVPIPSGPFYVVDHPAITVRVPS